MDFLNVLGDWFQTATVAIERFITILFGSAIQAESVNSDLSATSGVASNRIPGSLLDRINSQEADWPKLSDRN